MSKAISDVIDNTKEIFMTDSALSTLLDFERVLDELDIYVYKNWKEGIDYLQTFLKGAQDEFNWLNTDDIFDNVKGHITKRYYIT